MDEAGCIGIIKIGGDTPALGLDIGMVGIIGGAMPEIGPESGERSRASRRRGDNERRREEAP